MNTRLSQDAAEAMEWHERQAAFKVSERARWARAQPPKIVGTWAPVMTEQQQKEFQQYAAEHSLPF